MEPGQQIEEIDSILDSCHNQDLAAEVIYLAMINMKENPHLSPFMAFYNAAKDWDIFETEEEE